MNPSPDQTPDQAPEKHPGQPPPIAGLLLIDKPLGPTSMDVCRRVRHRLVRGGAPKRVKVGHGGALDPLASGLLVILVGRATRLCDAIMAGEKRYLTTIDLAHTSPTDDHESDPVPAQVCSPPSRERIDETLPRFTGEIMQAPPAHSAIMVDGERAYKLARKGQLDKLKPRPVVIHEITVADYGFPLLTLDVRCGKGVYIRSLARDLGHALGCGGMLHALRRTRVGRFDIADAAPFDRLPDELDPTALDRPPEVRALLKQAGS